MRKHKENAHILKVRYKEKRVAVINLDVPKFDVDINFVGFVVKNMIAHIIKILYQYLWIN